MLKDVRTLVDELCKKLKEKGSVLVAFSGGLDSSVVACLAHRALGSKAIAVTIDSPLLPPGELEDALKTARLIGIRHKVIKLNELELPGFSRNPRERCYLCKKFRFKKLKEMALQEGINVLVDGTNKSDALEYRPGLKAALEEGIYSPLLEAGLTKNDVLRIAIYLKLPLHNKPSNTCLATRIPYGQEITIERLMRIGLAEKVIKEILNLRIVRVRDHGDLARIEVDPTERRFFFNETALDLVVTELRKLGFRFVTLDLEGYKKGCFDTLNH
ncbi:MAG: ATP-dependent sacrificial sulfur transferase LarE [Candidatus Nezhaarchaeales archaeon]